MRHGNATLAVPCWDGREFAVHVSMVRASAPGEDRWKTWVICNPCGPQRYHL